MKIISFLIIGMLSFSFAYADGLQLKAGHPIRYTVQPGDTLWEIADKYLDNPLQWRELMQANPQVDNPYRLYVGEVLVLNLVNGRPALTVERGGVVKLSPEIRSTPIEQAIPTIPMEQLRPFLNSTRVVSPSELAQAPYVIAHAEEHIVTGAGDRVYIAGTEGHLNNETSFSLYRQGQPYIDPQTKQILGYEGIYVGDVRLEKAGEPATFRLTESNGEVLTGDRLLPLTHSFLDIEITPHIPKFPIHGQIISVLQGVTQVGQYNVVSINRGLDDGLQVGDILSVEQLGNVIHDPYAKSKKKMVRLPNEKAGNLIVFRIFDKVSYGLILRATRPIHISDIVATPT